MKRKREESYETLYEVCAPKSPKETSPHQFAILWFGGDVDEDGEEEAWLTTHKSRADCNTFIITSDGIDGFSPEMVVDLESGEHWEVVFTPNLSHCKGDYFVLLGQEDDGDDGDEEDDDA